MTNEDELTSLKARIAELEAKVSPPKSTFVPMTDEEWRSQMHALSERRMSMAMPPSAIRDLNVLDEALLKGVRGDARAPTGRPGMIPQSQTSGSGRPSSGGTGWVDPRPLTNPPGTPWVDAQCIADEVRQRAELKRKLGE
jgi:hypothetical protein